MAHKTKDPARAKSKRYPVEIAAAAWFDLLGYGAMLRDVGFDPTQPDAAKAVTRLRAFQRALSDCADRHFPIMIINDGAVLFRDLSSRDKSVTFDFLARAVDLFAAANAVDQDEGYPGARMILAAGARMRVTGVVRSSASHRTSILRRMEDGLISPRQAVHEAFRAEPVAAFVPMLQANFAFTKAYLADQDGSRSSLGGAKCYLDCALFQDALPNWIQFGRIQQWSQQGLSAQFGELHSLDRPEAGRQQFRGIRNAIEVAAALGVQY